MTEKPAFAAGQCWRYATPPGFDTSRIVIGAIATFSADRRIVCLSVVDAPEKQPDGTIATVTIPFIAMTEAALAATVTEPDFAGTTELPNGFARELDAWHADPRGLTCFTVRFEGYLDRLVAHQMAAIIGTNAA